MLLQHHLPRSPVYIEHRCRKGQAERYMPLRSSACAVTLRLKAQCDTGSVTSRFNLVVRTGRGSSGHDDHASSMSRAVVINASMRINACGIQTQPHKTRVEL